jgi:hypothetical protein
MCGHNSMEHYCRNVFLNSRMIYYVFWRGKVERPRRAPPKFCEGLESLETLVLEPTEPTDWAEEVHHDCSGEDHLCKCEHCGEGRRILDSIYVWLWYHEKLTIRKGRGSARYQYWSDLTCIYRSRKMSVGVNPSRIRLGLVSTLLQSLSRWMNSWFLAFSRKSNSIYMDV